MIQEDFLRVLFKSIALAISPEEQQCSIEWINHIATAVQEVTYTKGSVILAPGETPDAICFLKKGAIRASYRDIKGRENTLYLWEDHSLATDITNYVSKKPSDLRIEVCTDVDLIVLKRFDLDSIIDQYPEALQFLNALLFHALHHHRERDMDGQALTAEEQIHKFFSSRTYPELSYSRRWIASYLGMTPSRYYELRNKIQQKKRMNNR
jgi:CRP-like cAMP-binding protein